MPRTDELLVPPGVDLAELAARYRCSDCGAAPARYRIDAHGTHHVDITHRPGCPVRRGVVDGRPDAVRAILATAN